MDIQLTAVMAADVVGYSQMMGADAARTLGNLRRMRAELFAPMIASYRGKVVKNMGDGWIVTFASASEAVTCAMRLQDKIVLEPEIRIRVGIHIGDVTKEDEDVFGEGVNIAARLEALTEPGGVSVSDAVYSMLDGTLRPAFDDVGEQQLKNIDQPVRVWSRGGLTEARQRLVMQQKKSILPLNIVPVGCTPQTDELASLANAMTNDLDTFLSTWRWLSVQVRVEPDADVYVLRPVLRASGSRLRLETLLLDPSGGSIGHFKHDGAMTDIFDWQDATVNDIVDRVQINILDNERERIEAIADADRSWKDWTLLAARADFTTRTSLKENAEYLRRAMAMNPPDSTPHQLFLGITATASTFGFADIMEEFSPLIPMAVARIEDMGQASARKVTMAYPKYVRTRNVAEAHAEVAAVMRDMPFDPDALINAGFVFMFTGHAARGLECFQKFRTYSRFHPLSIGAEGGTGACLMLLGRYEEALAHLDTALQAAPSYTGALRWKIACLAHLGRMAEAKEALACHDQYVPGYTITDLRKSVPYVDGPETERYLDGLRRAGVAE